MNKYEKLYERACEKTRCPSWLDVCITPLVCDLEEYTGNKTNYGGPYGLRAAVCIQCGEKYLTVTAEFRDNSIQLFYDTEETTDRFQPGTLGALNGLNIVSAPLPGSIGEIAALLRD